MSPVVAVVGNPKPGSRTRTAAEVVAAELSALVPGIAPPVQTVDLAEHSPALLQWGSPEVAELKATVLGACALVVASPTYKAAYTGLLKLFLDQFDKDELHGIPTVALMTGGNDGHALAVEVHLRPVLVEIGASLPTRGLFLSGPAVDDPAAAIADWLEQAAPALRRALAVPQP